MDTFGLAPLRYAASPVCKTQVLQTLGVEGSTLQETCLPALGAPARQTPDPLGVGGSVAKRLATVGRRWGEGIAFGRGVRHYSGRLVLAWLLGWEQKRMTAIQRILDDFRALATSPREQGDWFEQLILAYLKQAPEYQSRFSEVWLWKDWPDRGKRPDTGIDLVAKLHHQAGFCAIQCKFYDPERTLEKASIDSFFTASGKDPFTERLIVSTTDRWSKNAEEALVGQQIPVTRLRFQDLEKSPFDWSAFQIRRPDTLQRLGPKTLRRHQEEALAATLQGFETSDRGKLIMACGTGKTFTSLKIAEALVPPNGLVLFLVPSLSLLSQTLREWTAESRRPIRSFAVCSDSAVGRAKASKPARRTPSAETEDLADITPHDLAIPPTTHPDRLLRALVPSSLLLADRGPQTRLPLSAPPNLPPSPLPDPPPFTVIFSTYHSIDVLAQAQKGGLPSFDLILCDEAHRTTGSYLKDEGSSHFLHVHDDLFLKGSKRLYMTATPKVFGDSARSKAQESDAVLCSMDDPALFGPEFYRLGFGEAIARGLLSDYKVMILAVDEAYVSRTFQAQIADENHEIKLDDAVKITGCWNGLSKRFLDTDPDADLFVDPAPMRRAVAFSHTIQASKSITQLFRSVLDTYRASAPPGSSFLSCEVDHVDGSQNALTRNQKLDWLKEQPPPPSDGSLPPCRILSNARCLSEGVDVPALDAVLFLHPRKSQVDIVQSVGRIMRKAPGKKYGYILLPIGIPLGIPPEQALRDHDKYKVVWQVLQALRSHDDRFDILINQLRLNKNPPPQIQIIGVSGPPSSEGQTSGDHPSSPPSQQFSFHFNHLEDWRDAILARIVQTCGQRPYWERWAHDVASIAQRHSDRIRLLLDGTDPRPAHAFNDFLSSLHSQINDRISREDAIEMLSQHLITQPIFEALFGHQDFTRQNPISLSMQKVLALLQGQALHKETEALDSFYQSVQRRVQGIDNAEGKQTIILELYDTFFRTAFPRMAERLGIVYTPLEVVDFILHSADAILRHHFDSSLSHPNVHILDPFTGTGTFLVRLLQSNLLRPEDLKRKYHHELHANEIVLLAYYIASINIESAFHEHFGGLRPPSPPQGAGRPLTPDPYLPFPGIVLTDTFQSSEKPLPLLEPLFPENNQRLLRQKSTPIRVILGNPPYSAGQKSENENNKNLEYPALDQRIRDTYAKHSSSTNKNSLYDSYIRAIRWASDRLTPPSLDPSQPSPPTQGLIAFVTNGSFLDNNAMSGLRCSLFQEFSSIYCFNLRGNQRTSGETSKREGGKIFGSGSRTPVAITLLVKNPKHQGPCELFYYDIGEYLDREEKLKKIRDFGSIEGITAWERLTPNENHDWINPRSPEFDTFLPLGNKDGEDPHAIFGDTYSSGLKTNRDTWCYNFSSQALSDQMQRMITFYNRQVEDYRQIPTSKNVETFIDNDPTKISWSAELKKDLGQFVLHKFDAASIVSSAYRPFCKQWAYFSRDFNERVYQMPKLFPGGGRENLVICTTGAGAGKDFSALISDRLPNLHFLDTSQCFPLYVYEEGGSEKAATKDKKTVDFLREEGNVEESEGRDVTKYKRREGVTDWALGVFREAYGEGERLTKEDIFTYVYGVLHSPEYRSRFASDLKKRLGRIPLLEGFWEYSKAGRELAGLHAGYEEVEPYPLEEERMGLALGPPTYRVEKMIFGKKDGAVDKTTIIYNSDLRLTGIPLEAYEYVVNGKPAVEWVMERYQVTVDKDSGIRNDPNEWSEDPRYVLDLVKRVVRVSVRTMEVVKGLPGWEVRKRGSRGGCAPCGGGGGTPEKEKED